MIKGYLENLVVWLFIWRLKMNASKCCYKIQMLLQLDNNRISFLVLIFYLSLLLSLNMEMFGYKIGKRKLK